MIDTRKKLEFNIRNGFNWINFNKERLSFLGGKKGIDIYEKLNETIKDGIWYDKYEGIMEGSHVFAAARLDSILKDYGGRIANLKDLGSQEVRKMLRENPDYPGLTHYSHAPALILRSEEETVESDFIEKNNLLIRYLLPTIEDKQGKIKLPVLITGFDVKESQDRKGYGLVIAPRKDFNVHYDERLLGKYDLYHFNNIDKIGLPIDLAKQEGYRAWLTKKDGISGIYFDRNIFSNELNLKESSKKGKLIIILNKK